jgi:hypothetical protein
MAAELGRLDAALDRAGPGQPQVLLVLEDLHWADRATLDLVAFLARTLHSGRVTLAVPGGRGGYLADALLARPGALPGGAVAVVVLLRPQRLRRPDPAAGPGRAADADRGPAVAPLAVAGPRPCRHRGGLVGGAFNSQPLEPPLQSVTSPWPSTSRPARRPCGCSTT